MARSSERAEKSQVFRLEMIRGEKVDLTGLDNVRL